MQQTLLACLVAVAAAGAAFQSPALPPPFPRTNARLLYENSRINVWDIVWPSGQPTALHRHIYDQVGTYYTRGGRVIRSADGQVRSTMTEIGGLSTTRKGTTHIEEGNTDAPLRAVFIELKADHPSGQPPAFIGQPVEPREAVRQIFDDDRVTVWDVTWSAGHDGPRYRAARETVIVWLGEGTMRVAQPGGATVPLPVRPGTMRHLDRGAGDTLEGAAGSPRAYIFELK
jgi:hypothetical protein